MTYLVMMKQNRRIDDASSHFHACCEKYFKKSKDKPLKTAFKEAIMSIRENPDIGDAKTGDLKGLYSLDVYNNRINYELAYRISHL